MKRTPLSLLLLIIAALSVYCLFTYESSFAQTNPPSQTPPAPVMGQDESLRQIPAMVRNSKSAGAVFEQRQLVRAENRLFQPNNQVLQDPQQVAAVLNDGAVFELNKPAVATLIQDGVPYLTLSLPDSRGAIIDLELVRVNIFAPGFSMKTAVPTNEQINNDAGLHYRGIVKGNDRSLAAISIFENEMMGFFTTEADGDSVVGRLGGTNPTDTHIVYAEKDLRVETPFSCDTKDTGAPLPESALQAPSELAGQCIRIYVEADFDLFQNKGSVTNTANYITALFNQSATLYSNDGISITLSELMIWNVQSPYAGLTSTGSILTKFQQTRTSFNGDFGHLVALRGNGGIAATINGFCASVPSRECFSGIFSTFSNVPTYSWSVEVFTHELGHLLGSHHTHACVWNGNGTAIDSCGPTAGFSEGSCTGAPLPSNGGTIMSYCHLVPNVGINFTLGFGTQPRNRIINLVNTSTCLQNCGGFTIGQGAPNPQLFINAANRNNFLQFAKQPPTSPVHRWNCATCDPNNPTWGKGLIQDFDDITPGVHDALMLADTNTNFVAQIYGGMWDKFVQLGGPDFNTANSRMIGYPIADRNCSDFNATCFTDAQLVSFFGTSYHYQRFQGGAFVQHRSGPKNTQTFEVHGPIRARWLVLNGPDGSFGLPISDEFASNGKRRSDFEGGSICFNPATNQTEDNCGTPAPANDSFANAQVISNSSGFADGTNAGATKEPGEPLHAGNSGGKSVWYRWQAPASGNTTITAGANYDSLLAVYTGTAVGSLTHIASNDDDPNGGVSSRVTFSATSGTTYRIAVDGFDGDFGNITLN
ncbi:MAG TPA: M12 family metallo-peptidase, partial [Pyrinomonadaceae bacterium]|nr:M12 family metallo-peptidase [Pyrinomonadaceae bacterium]